jgi:hypothetical protein
MKGQARHPAELVERVLTMHAAGATLREIGDAIGRSRAVADGFGLSLHAEASTICGSAISSPGSRPRRSGFIAGYTPSGRV